MNKFTKRILIPFFIIILAALIGLYFYTSSKLNEKIPLDGSGELIVKIPKNASLEETVEILNKKGVFLPNWYFMYACKAYSAIHGSEIIPGAYKFEKGNTNLTVLKALHSGEEKLIVWATYPEGIQIARFAQISARKIGIDSAEFVNFANSKAFLDKHGIKAESAEGWLMPDTYQFYWKTNIEEILDKLITQRKKTLPEDFEIKAKKSGLSVNGILTLASIIEAETPAPEEMPLVSCVYHNRLDFGWKLEADPTVQFALGKKKKLYYKDLEIDSPYNTYRYEGLPPGPINSPGAEAILAALNPADCSYLFFVAKGDGSGRHLFAENAQGHKKNKIIYKRNSAKRKAVKGLP